MSRLPGRALERFRPGLFGRVFRFRQDEGDSNPRDTVVSIDAAFRRQVRRNNEADDEKGTTHHRWDFHSKCTHRQAGAGGTDPIGGDMGRGEASSKKVVTREQWEKKLASIKVKKEDMNKLVMNFLVTEGYLDAAKLFQEESGTEMHGDEMYITQRMHIRKALQSGDVEGAIDKVNDLNPGILEDRDHLFFHLQQQKLIELIRECNVEEALEFAQEYLAPRGEENEAFLEELEKTVALLAFEDASTCPIKDLLEFSQRQKTAGELNSAILASQGKEKEPRLPGLLRMLTWAQQKLDEKVVYPRINDLSTGKLEDPPLE